MLEKESLFVQERYSKRGKYSDRDKRFNSNFGEDIVLTNSIWKQYNSENSFRELLASFCKISDVDLIEDDKRLYNALKAKLTKKSLSFLQWIVRTLAMKLSKVILLTVMMSYKMQSLSSIKS